MACLRSSPVFNLSPTICHLLSLICIVCLHTPGVDVRKNKVEASAALAYCYAQTIKSDVTD